MLSTSTEEKRSYLADNIRRLALVTRDERSIIDTRGNYSNWLIDLRPTLLDAEALEAICDLFWEENAARLPFQIGGMEVAAVPLVTGLLMSARLRGLSVNAFIIRKERKNTGLTKAIEGQVTEEPIVLVDDILNSGNSLDKARAVLEQEGHQISRIFTIIDYNSPKGLSWRKRYNYPVSALFKLEEFGLDMASSKPVPKIDYTILWRHYEPGAYPFHVVPKSGPLLAGNRLYVGTSTAKMQCVSLEGELLWEFDAKGTAPNPKGIMSFPAIHDGRIYFGAYNGCVYCLNAETGQEIWRNPCCDWVGSSPLIVPELGALFIGLESARPRQKGSNAALRLDNGTRIWEVGQQKYQHGSAAYYKPKNLVIFGNANHDVSAYDARTGVLVWEDKTGRSIKYPPAVDAENKLVATSSFDGNIYVHHVETGKRLAAIQTDDICYSTPLFAGGKIFCGSGDKHMYVIDAQTFELLEKIYCYSRVFSSPKQMGDTIIFGTNGGRIYELDAKSLEIVGHTHLPDAITNAIAYSEDFSRIYARTYIDELYCLERTMKK